MTDERPSLTPGDPLRERDLPRHPSGLPELPDERQAGADPRTTPGGDEHQRRDPSAWPAGGGDPESWPSSASGTYRPPVRPESSEAVTGGSASLDGREYVLAGWWQRVGAALIDGLIIVVLAVALIALLGVGFVAADTSAGAEALIVTGVIAVLVFSVAALVYAPVMLWKTDGRTLGRMATGIRVVRADGRQMTFGVAALREVVLKGLVFGTLSQFTAGLAFVIDVCWPLWDQENRALHDFPVNTRTVIDR